MKTKAIFGLFVALIIILALNPRILNNIYSTILGRLALIGIVIFFSMNNVILGLLVALAIITASNQFGSFVEGSFVEGMDTMAQTIGEDNTPITGQQVVLTKTALPADSVKQKISELKASTNASTTNASTGVDKETIRNSIMPKDSKTIKLDPNMMKNDDVNAYDQSMLTNTSSMTEGFCLYAATF